MSLVADPHVMLDVLSSMPDDEIVLAEAALALASFDLPGISVDRYQHHLKVLANETAERHAELLEAGADDNLETRLAALKHVISDSHAYVGDELRQDDLENANLIRVIDRAKGASITLSCLYIHAARAQGWDIAGLNIPGHFVCRLEDGGERLIFDPFQYCKVLEAQDLRMMVKSMMGAQAELSSHYFDACTNRGILIQLQNIIKHRLIEDEDYVGALKIVKRMRLIDPDEFRLLLDAGVLYARVEQTKAAIEALEDYIARVPKDRNWQDERYDAQLLLEELRGKLN